MSTEPISRFYRLAATPSYRLPCRATGDGSRHRYGPADLHPRLDHGRPLPMLQSFGELVRVAASGGSVITIWRTRSQ
ncbi:hypothetical protein ACQP1V_09845 [Microtetraspora malaysiensis]|uniref:hypothetical protein n=1 Tax=Microtetraspora malaysiensis TaxID=161358 RepID=UPI003D89F0D9